MKEELHRANAASVDLIDRLVADLDPVTPVKTGRMVAVCFGIQLCVALAAAWVFGIGPAAFTRMTEPALLLIVTVLALNALGCSYVAMRSAIPGRGVARPLAVLLLSVPLLLVVGISFYSPWGGTWGGFAHLFATGKACMAQISAIAVLPWLAMLLALRVLAPLRELATGMFIGLSAFSLGALAVQLTCSVTDHYHLAFAHYVPVAVGTVLLGVLSAIFLRRREN